MVVYYHNTEIRLRSRHALIVRMYGKVIEYYPKAGVVLFVLYITHSTVEQKSVRGIWIIGKFGIIMI